MPWYMLSMVKLYFKHLWPLGKKSAFRFFQRYSGYTTVRQNVPVVQKTFKETDLNFVKSFTVE